MKKYFILISLLLIVNVNDVQALSLYDKIIIPNSKVLTNDIKSSNRLSKKFIKTLVSNQEINTILQEMAKDNNIILQPFQYDKKRGIKFFNIITEKEKQKIKTKFKKTDLQDGYYFYVKYKSTKREVIINIGLSLGEFILDKSSPISGTVGNILIPFLKDKVFKVTKYRQLRKFNNRYRQINTIMVEVLMQTYKNDIKDNPDSYGINKIKIYTKTLRIPKNSNVEIYADEVIIDNDL